MPSSWHDSVKAIFTDRPTLAVELACALTGEPVPAGPRPALAALSVAYHGTDPAVIRAFDTALRNLPPKRAAKYHEHAYNMSPHAVQEIMGRLMTAPAWPVYTPFAKEHYGRGKAEGEADAIVLVLEARGLDVTEADRDRITGCTDLQTLKTWVTRAATAEKTSDIFD